LYAGEGLREMGRKCWVAMRLEVWDEAEPAGGEVPGRWSVSILEVRGGIRVSMSLPSWKAGFLCWLKKSLRCTGRFHTRRHEGGERLVFWTRAFGFDRDCFGLGCVDLGLSCRRALDFCVGGGAAVVARCLRGISCLQAM
jgi:hypothetical protein